MQIVNNFLCFIYSHQRTKAISCRAGNLQRTTTILTSRMPTTTGETRAVRPCPRISKMYQMPLNHSTIWSRGSWSEVRVNLTEERYSPIRADTRPSCAGLLRRTAPASTATSANSLTGVRNFGVWQDIPSTKLNSVVLSTVPACVLTGQGATSYITASNPRRACSPT